MLRWVCEGGAVRPMPPLSHIRLTSSQQSASGHVRKDEDLGMRHSRRGPRPEAVPKSGTFQRSWPRWALSALTQAPVVASGHLPPLADTWWRVYVSFPLLARPQSRRAAVIPSRGSAVFAVLAIIGPDEVACSPSHSVPRGWSQP